MATRGRASRSPSPDIDLGLCYPGKAQETKKEKTRRKLWEARADKEQEDNLVRLGRARRLNIDMSEVTFVKNNETLGVEMHALLNRADELQSRGISNFVALDTEQRQIKGQPNQVCVIQLSS